MVQSDETRRERFRSLLHKRGLSVAAISRLSAVPATTLYSYLDGKTSSLTCRTERKIAASLGLLSLDTFHEPHVMALPIIGHFSANGVFHKIKSRVNLMTSLLGPVSLSSDRLEAYVIDTDALPPFKSGHRVFTHNVKATSADKLIGEICVVELDTGKILLKTLRKSRIKGSFNLEDLNTKNKTLKAVKIVSAKKVVLVSFEK
jgi:lambda repressor-like predicted transcriptional regulator